MLLSSVKFFSGRFFQILWPSQNTRTLTLVKSLPTCFSPNFRRYVVYNVYSEDAKLFVSCWLHYILYRKQDFELFTWHLSITLISCWKKSKDWFLKFLLEISMFFYNWNIEIEKNYCNSLHPHNLTFGKLLWFDDLLILKQVLVSVFYALCFRWACSLLSIIGYWVKCGIVVLKWFSMP